MPTTEREREEGFTKLLVIFFFIVSILRVLERILVEFIYSLHVKDISKVLFF